ncbi:putative HTH-type transcriptional regulator YybR [Pseudovibrio axinellae]|uniref:Putative HTH-type transcriptional regulator YybR n=1 Tax=Pseudovibrio axinellae TaxID=989403 RepID=A0A165ZHL5_9HYPH|nr:helix-turn-helix domain-containing protein [Pseudovibrio axinellae]KZL19906.1 putative HTH-type transcriptional regulator YybR [Pseudovibrio axinellae]SER37598.1 transcriptional regulator, HxlR family [Pseudovibrio axinellae]
MAGETIPLEKSLSAIETTVATIGGKWKPVLMFHLLSGAKRFSELQKLMPGASDRMLARSLRELENDAILRREVFTSAPVRVEYSLTKDGMSLIPVLNVMSEWGQARNGSDETIEPTSVFDALLPTFGG